MRFLRQALWLWYRGTEFHGFQWQKDGRSVQQAIEEGWRAVGVGARPMGAGRTDRGVSARMQVVLLKTSKDVPVDAVVRATNAALGEHGGVALTRAAAASFHPQWSAIGKEYRYRLWLREDPAPPFTWSPPHRGVRIDALREVVAELRRTADFSALHARGSVRKPRTIHRAEVEQRTDGIVELRLAGDSFAKHQVRILAGTAVKVAAGVLTREAWRAALEHQAPIDGEVAPSEALVLWAVHYPVELDPFTTNERTSAPGVPAVPPFDQPFDQPCAPVRPERSRGADEAD